MWKKSWLRHDDKILHKNSLIYLADKKLTNKISIKRKPKNRVFILSFVLFGGGLISM